MKAAKKGCVGDFQDYHSNCFDNSCPWAGSIASNEKAVPVKGGAFQSFQSKYEQNR